MYVLPVVIGAADGSPLLRWCFVSLTLALAVAFIGAVFWTSLQIGRGVRHAARHAFITATLTFTWIGATGIAASRGVLQFEPPPTMLVVVALVILLGVGIPFTPAGRALMTHLPLWLLVGFQGFRVAVELLLHRAYTEGLMPVQMSYSGRNFDIVSGLTALALAAWLASGRSSRRLVIAWNALGALLLANIVGIALLSAPTPVRVFMNEPANTWVTRAPWVWLPAVMVLAAIVGHVLVFRRLRLDAARAATTAAVVAPPDAMPTTPGVERPSRFFN
jgi:hypothetical protein